MLGVDRTPCYTYIIGKESSRKNATGKTLYELRRFGEKKVENSGLRWRILDLGGGSGLERTSIRQKWLERRVFDGEWS